MTRPSPLRPSRVLGRLRAGGTATCVKINLRDPRVVQIAAQSGFDCVWLDLEHVPNSIQDIECGINAAKASDCDTVVRVCKGSYSDYVRPLEADAAGIMVPHVMSADEARRIIEWTRFHPLGRRALDGGNADAAFCGVSIDAYIQHANRERLVILQIEDVEAMEELDEIARTPGVDLLFFGPGDFTQSLGKPGRFDDPRVHEARREVAEAARRHGKFAGTVTGIDEINSLQKMGYRFLSVGADVVALLDSFQRTVSRFDSDCGSDAAASPYSQDRGARR